MSQNKLRLLFPIGIIFFCRLIQQGEPFIFKSSGIEAAMELSKASNQSSEKLAQALQNSTSSLNSSIQTAAKSLEKSAKILGKSGENIATELSDSIKTISSDLLVISFKLSNSFDKGVANMSGVMKDAINATKFIANRLSDSVDNAVKEASGTVKDAMKEVKAIAKDLTGSVDNAVGEFGESVRYLADKIAEVSKQIDVRVNSGDFVDLGREIKEGLITSIETLSESLSFAVDTADLKEIGADAAAELSKALQNAKLRLELKVELDDNSTKAVLYLSVAGGVACSVLFITVIIAMKSCRSCTVKSFSMLGSAISKKQTNDEESPGKGHMEMQPMRERRQRNPKHNYHPSIHGNYGKMDYPMRYYDDSDDGEVDYHRKQKLVKGQPYWDPNEVKNKKYQFPALTPD